MIGCIVCKNFSFSIICKKCQKNLLTPTKITRVLADGFKIYSFYRYNEIQDLLKTKHTHLGAEVYKIMAKNSFKEFAKNFRFNSTIYAIAIDDHVKHGYSHTAILTKALKSSSIKPLYNVLRAKNSISYSTKSLEYRLKNPREFQYSFKSGIDVILVDDIITTGTTILEAKTTLQKYHVNTIFALTLADAKET